MEWAVVHLIHVRTPHVHIPKAFIANVPEDVDAEGVRKALDRAGFTCGEFGIPWANHHLAPEAEWPPEVREAENLGASNVRYFDWSDITPEGQQRRMTLRTPEVLASRCQAAAKAAGVSLNAWAVTVLDRASQEVQR